MRAGRAGRAVALGVSLLAAGCGTVTAPVSTAPAAAQVPAGRTATAAGNRNAARAEAARLLTLARLPRAAVRLARPPRSLPGPAMGRPAASSLVDRVRAFEVGQPFGTVSRWLRAHPPHGMPLDGTANGNGNTMAGASYRGPANPAWQSADLEISVAPAGPDASMIRVDAVILWLDPRPVRSGPGAHPARVTVAGRCPSADQAVTGVTNPGAGLSQRLLPSGRPTAGLRCRYNGAGGRRPWHLAATTRLTAAQARQAARSVARIPLSHPDGEITSCPMDIGSAEVLVLAYPGRADVDLWITLSGCRTVSNGYISAADL